MVVGDIAVEVEVVVIGGGPGGYVAAIRAAQLGKEVVLIDKDTVGGVCLNRGCIPSKAVIHAAKTAATARKSEHMGIRVTGVEVDMEQVQAWKGGVVSKLTGGVQSLLKANGVTVVSGSALFMADNRIGVETPSGMEYFKYEHCILATGSRPVQIPAFPFDGEHILSSTEALALTEIPPSLLVIGGGYIGLELGTAFAKFGSRVTIIEMGANLLPGVDPTLVQIVKKNLKKLGVEILTQAAASGYEIRDGQIHVTADVQGNPRVLSADKVLVTVGRRPNTEELGLAQVGLTPDARGFLETDAQQRTQNATIFAIGDITHGPMLAHKASKEGIVAAEVIAGHASEMDAVAIPAVIFTDPEIATVGLSETEAQERGMETVVGKFPFAANGRALTTNDGDGFCTVVAEKSSGVVLGVHIVGPEASTLIGEATLAIEMGATLEDFHLTVHAHPTLSEVLMEAAADADGVAVHIAKRK
ncbi:dihydrolipoyl dehydrogenase [Tumebacillus permanentifrigoris]|uniref:Dihydrolipoyl dehydrogenase n=1 Tax=Tumebacillus permanentifrigoris TaxID=378543 RepID=A0A316D3E7_9BACL|nr:dihydrolipoyl dehydrogenase [Tumebacillus permanentifrigoris]PWK05405.1 dihydrolipoamide dehydrogenase [Tumebacillus permanentifrigoris]